MKYADFLPVVFFIQFCENPHKIRNCGFQA